MKKINDTSINSTLSIVIISTSIIVWSIFSIRKNFDLNMWSQIGQSIIEYKYRIFSVLFVNLLIILGISIPHKPRFLHIFCNFWNLITYTCTIIYIFTADFKQRFGIISEANIIEFYTVILPIFIGMLFVFISMLHSGDTIIMPDDKEDRDKARDELSKSLKPYKKHNYNKHLSILFLFIIFILFYIFLFILGWTGKVNQSYAERFVESPLPFLVLIYVILLLLTYKLNSDINTDLINSPNLTNKKNKRISKPTK